MFLDTPFCEHELILDACVITDIFSHIDLGRLLLSNGFLNGIGVAVDEISIGFVVVAVVIGEVAGQRAEEGHLSTCKGFHHLLDVGIQFLCGIVLLVHKVRFEVIVQFLTNTRNRFVCVPYIVETIRVGKDAEQTVADIAVSVKPDGRILGSHFLYSQRKDGVDESVFFGSVEKLIEFCYHVVGFGCLCGRVLDG